MTTSTNFHAGSRASQDYLYDTNVATPSHAERARTLADCVTTGALSTLAGPESTMPGFPYGSLVTTAIDGGCPIFLISGLAEHTQNLLNDGRASLLLSEAGDESPLALGRISLVGECSKIAEHEQSAPQQAYFSKHPEAEYYLNYGDFSFWRLAVQSVRYIGGFGRMSWITTDDWFNANSDPLAPHAGDIIAHMNADHVKAMTDYCRAFSRASEFSSVQMTAVDRYGFEMSVETNDGWRPIRLAFDETVTTPGETRQALVVLAKRARAALGVDAAG